MGEGAAKTKLIGTKSEVAFMEVKLGANKKLTYLSSKSKNSEIIEGRGNTTLVKFGDGEVSYEAKEPEAGKEVSSKYKFSINNIEFGDMIKMMLGQIEPISISADFDYTGHDLFELIKKAQNPAEKDKINQVAGAVLLNDFYIKMGQSGLLAKGDFNFDAKKPEGADHPDEPTVNGTFQATLAGYQTLINYLTRFFPVPPEEINKNIAFLKEVGEDKGNDIGFDIKIENGKVTVNGKTEEQVMEIKNRYFPPVDLNSMSDRGMSMDGAVPSAAPNAPEAAPSPTIPTQPEPLASGSAPLAPAPAPMAPAVAPTDSAPAGMAPAPVEGTKTIQ
jgi:hypothetical protein